VCWCVLLYTIILTLEFAPAVFEGLRKPKIARAIHKFVVPTAIIGVTLSMMHQSTLGTLYLAMPHKLHTLWHSAMLPLFFLISSIGMGMSTVILAVLVGHKAMGKTVSEEGMGVLRGMAKASVFIWAVYLLLKVEDLVMTGQLGAAFAFDAQSIWFLVELLIGVILPIILFARSQVRNSQRGLLGTALLVTLGIILNRFNTVLVGQKVVEGASYTPHWMEVAVQVGVLAAVILAWYLAVSLLPIFEDDRLALEAEPTENFEVTPGPDVH